MILIDRRSGSGELLGLFPAGAARLDDLPFGDFAFTGKGPGGEVLVGIERKRLLDLLSCIRTGRFAGHQIPGLLSTYGFVYLIVEGIYRPNPDTGVLEETHRGSAWVSVALGRQAWMYRELDAFLVTVETKTPIHVRRSIGPRETVQQVSDLYRWWNEKEWSEHHAHLALHQEPMPVTFTPPSLVRRVAKELPGVGWERSGAIAERFPTVLAMVQADEKEWRAVPGVGKVLAARIVKELHGGQHEETT